MKLKICRKKLSF